LKPDHLAAELGRLPDVAIPDDPLLIKSSTAEGVPFVLAQPRAKASQQIMGIAQRLTAPPEDASRPVPILAGATP
jgi:MinD-like ATPase involved in chromosome partitioning or flagellar assembly